MNTPSPEKIIELVASVTRRDPATITMETRFMEDLNANSLDVVELACLIEGETGVHLSEAEIVKIRTVGDVLKVVQEQKPG